jgi:hypothetical protein
MTLRGQCLNYALCMYGVMPWRMYEYVQWTLVQIVEIVVIIVSTNTEMIHR